MNALLDARGLSKRFVARTNVFGKPVAHVQAVDGVDLTLEPGETLALVGESGCGKSTLGRMLMRLIEPSGGALHFNGRDLLALDDDAMRHLRREIQIIFQDPFASLNPRMSVGEAIAEPLLLHGIVPPAERAARVASLLETVGLRAEHAGRYPHEFSGGQRQRIVIARALASEPRLIICDEPVSALDVSIRAQILNLLRDLQRRLGLAMIFISHDLGVVKHIADRVAVMYLGRIVEIGPADAVFAQPRHPYTHALLSAIPMASAVRRSRRVVLEGDVPSPLNPPPGCHLHRRCPHAQPRCRDAVPLLAGEAGHRVACHVSADIRFDEAMLPRETQPDPRLSRLLSAFEAGTPSALPDPSPPET